ncbi:MAG: NAD(P)-dependent oxidoreductase [Nitrospinota bacterium]|nr:NAD(P)-dependent oxidoreductase [Nitrospinota bacterium]
MKILLTGASGGLGSELLKNLIENENNPVRVLVHKSSVDLENCEKVEGALSEPGSLEKATRGIDTVVHLAALTRSSRKEDYFVVNAQGTRNLVNASRGNRVRRFIYVSSTAAHEHAGGYGISKLEGEKWVQRSGLQWLVLRASEAYGYYAGREGVNQLIHWVKESKTVPVIGNGECRLCPIFIDDLIFVMTEAIFREDLSARVFILAGPEPMTFNSLVDRLNYFFKVRSRKIHFSPALVQWGIAMMSFFKIGSLVSDQVPRLLCEKEQDIGAATKAFNFQPGKLEEGLRKMFPSGGVNL